MRMFALLFLMFLFLLPFYSNAKVIIIRGKVVSKKNGTCLVKFSGNQKVNGKSFLKIHNYKYHNNQPLLIYWDLTGVLRISKDLQNKMQ